MTLELTPIQIGNREISQNSAFIIAEIGSNHSQDLKLAKEYIRVAKLCGADAVKFQFFEADDLVDKNHPKRGEVESYVTPTYWIKELHEYSTMLDIIFFASTFNLKLFHTLDASGVKIHKIASSEILNASLLLAASRTKKPILASFGMSEWYEVEIAMKILRQNGNDKIIPMHCVAKYPLPLDQANLQLIEEFKHRFDTFVGFSDHTESKEIGGWAVSKGARIFEKHLTFNRSNSGADHSFALEPDDFKIYIENIRSSVIAQGNGEKSYLLEEKLGRRRLGTYLQDKGVQGKKLKELEIDSRGPRTEVPLNLIEFIGDLRLRRDLAIGEQVKWDDLE